MHRPKRSLKTEEECIKYALSLNEDNFLCLAVLLINSMRKLNYAQEEALISSFEYLFEFYRESRKGN